MKRSVALFMMLLMFAPAIWAEESFPHPTQAVSDGYAVLADRHGPYGDAWPVCAKMDLLRLMRDEGLPLLRDKAEEVLDTKITPARQDQLATALLAGGGEDADWPPRMQDINLDGWPDLLLITARGARNTRHDAWLWQPEARRFVQADFNGFSEGGLWDYCQPAPGLLLDRLRDGLPDSYWALYRWQGMTPVLLGRAFRTAYGDQVSEGVTRENGFAVWEESVPLSVYSDSDNAEQADRRDNHLLQTLLSLAEEPLAEEAPQPTLPDAVIALCDTAWPGYRIARLSGFGDAQRGQWALVLSRDGHNVLCIAEKAETDAAYAFTVQNEKALRQGPQLPSLLIDTGGDSLFFSYQDREANTSHHYHAVKDSQGHWGDVDMTVHHLALHREWTMYVEDGMQHGEVLLTDGNDNILRRQAYPPQPVPHLVGKTALADFDGSLYPNQPPENALTP